MSINHLTPMPLGLAIQRGNIPNFSGVQKFGYNTAVGTVFETIWENGSLYAYPTTPTTAVAYLLQQMIMIAYFIFMA